MLNRQIHNRYSFSDTYLGRMYKAWQTDPKSVSDQWDGFFKTYRPEEKQQQTSETQTTEKDIAKEK